MLSCKWVRNETWNSWLAMDSLTLSWQVNMMVVYLCYLTYHKLDYFRVKSAAEIVNCKRQLFSIYFLLLIVLTSVPAEKWSDAKNNNIMIAKVTGYFRGHGNWPTTMTPVCKIRGGEDTNTHHTQAYLWSCTPRYVACPDQISFFHTIFFHHHCRPNHHYFIIF